MQKKPRTRRPRKWPSVVGNPEERAATALARLEDITRLVSEWVWKTDADGRLVFVSERVSEILGFLPIELVGKTLTELGSFSIEGRRSGGPDWKAPFRELRFDMPSKNGEIRLFLVSGLPFYDRESWKLEGFCGIADDITKRKETEERLKEAKEQAERYLSIAGTTIVAIERSGAISLVNDAGCRLLGRDKGELIGRNWIDTVVPANGKAQVESIFSRVLSGGTESAEPVEYEVKTKDGKRKWIAWHKIALTDDRGEVVGVLSSGEDLTERLEAERRMQQFRKLESLGSLAGGIAHEINNMLHPALSLTKATLRQLPLGSRERIRLEKAIEANERIKGLVERILQFGAQPESVRAPVPLTPVVHDACNLLRSLALTSVEFHEQLEDDVGLVIADPSDIQTVLMNLGSNALDSMGVETGRLRISLSRILLEQRLYGTIPPLEPGSYAKLSVVDNGAGMDNETVERLLEPFFTTKEVGRGTGLGLSIVFGIVAKQGGAMDISTAIGAGTTVDVYFPIVDRTVNDTEGELEFSSRSSAEE